MEAALRVAEALKSFRVSCSFTFFHPSERTVVFRWLRWDKRTSDDVFFFLNDDWADGLVSRYLCRAGNAFEWAPIPDGIFRFQQTFETC